MAFITLEIEEDDFCKATGRWPASAGIAEVYELAKILDDGMGGTLLDRARRLVDTCNRRERLLTERFGIFGVWDRNDPDAPMHFVDAPHEHGAKALALSILSPKADIVVERMTVAALLSAIGHSGAAE